MGKPVEIYWDDLSPAKQQELMELWGDNGNYDVLPLIVIDTGSEENQLPIHAFAERKESSCE